MKVRTLAGVLLLLTSMLLMPCTLASEQNCTMAGTWYGGSADTKYMLTIVQDWTGNYTMLGFAGFTQSSIGFPVTTAFSNSVVKRHGHNWEFYGTGLVNSSSNFPAPNAELWAVHGRARLTACDTLQLDYDFFGAYVMPTEKKPFVSKPDYVVVPPPFREVYTRVPLVCTECGDV